MHLKNKWILIGPNLATIMGGNCPKTMAYGDGNVEEHFAVTLKTLGAMVGIIT